MVKQGAWHPDPAQQHELRFWDGVSWTAWVSDRGVASQAPLGRDLPAPPPPDGPPPVTPATEVSGGWLGQHAAALSLALIAIGALTWEQASSPSRAADLGLLAVPAALLWCALVVSALASRSRVSLPGWARRPTLGAAASAAFTLAAFRYASVTLGGLLFVLGWALFCRDAGRRGELGRFRAHDLGRLRALGVLAALAAVLSFSGTWQEDYSSVISSAGVDYHVQLGATSGYDRGANQWSSWLLLGAALALAYRPEETRSRRLTTIPVVLSAVLVAWGAKQLLDELRHVRFLADQGHSQLPGGGPLLFVLAASALLAVSVLIRRRPPEG